MTSQSFVCDNLKSKKKKKKKISWLNSKQTNKKQIAACYYMVPIEYKVHLPQTGLYREKTKKKPQPFRKKYKAMSVKTR